MAGVFGITRMTGMSQFKYFIRTESDKPAAIDTTTLSRRTVSLISAITAGQTFGFTARIRMSAKAAVLQFSSVIPIPYSAFNASSPLWFLSDTRISPGSAIPDFSIPPMIALHILPPPMNPNFRSIKSQLTFRCNLLLIGHVRCRYCKIIFIVFIQGNTRSLARKIGQNSLKGIDIDLSIGLSVQVFHTVLNTAS